MNEKFWKTKVAAFLHDPIEKAFILMRGEGHEKIAEDQVKQVFGEDAADLRAQTRDEVAVLKEADWFASGADRPNLPKESTAPFWQRPEIVHPLTGEVIDLGKVAEDLTKALAKGASAAHLGGLVCRRENGEVDWKATFFAFWRYGEEILLAEEKDAKKKELQPNLWRVSPADSRTPDHSIMEHLSLASAFAGAMAEGDAPALLLVSFGPVQGFIAQARKMNDLWSGSLMLSAITFCAIRAVAEELGPDAILFPQLRGITLMDHWMHRKVFGERLAERKPLSDSPGFRAAAFPNRFVALVPRGRAEEMARKAAEAAQEFVRGQGERMLEDIRMMLADKGRLDDKAQEELAHAGEQMEEQFADFPEAYWAVVDWGEAIVRDEKGKPRPDWGKMDELLAALGGNGQAAVAKALREKREGFFEPMAGGAFPGVYEALERTHAAAKSARPFEQRPQRGYRCTICGEREWLGDVSLRKEEPASTRALRKGEQMQTFWHRLHEEGVGLTKNGEHLCAWCALKRFWPRLMRAWLFGEDSEEAKRFSVDAVSTHAMALASSIEAWAQGTIREQDKEKTEKFVQELVACRKDRSPAWLPGRTAAEVKEHAEDLKGRYKDIEHPLRFARRLPAILDAVAEDVEGEETEGQFNSLRWKVEQVLGGRMERYYALVLMDGDRMGKWLSGEIAKEEDESGKCLLPIYKRLRSDLREKLKEGEHSDYWRAPRPVSPAWHQAISGALNNFSAVLARFVVEEMFTGKLIYAGGDDLMAMVAVRDLPALMLALRCLYSGELPKSFQKEDLAKASRAFFEALGARHADKLVLARGFARHKGRLYRMMGKYATASIGAIVTHHTAPLARVLRDLRAAEKRAKDAGRNAFALTVDKRGGGSVTFTGCWRLEDADGGDMHLFRELAALLGQGVSRRAAYAMIDRLVFLPEDAEVFAAVMQQEIRRKAKGVKPKPWLFDAIASRAGEAGKEWLRHLLIAAEFLGREGRIGVQQPRHEAKKEAV